MLNQLKLVEINQPKLIEILPLNLIVSGGNAIMK